MKLTNFFFEKWRFSVFPLWLHTHNGHKHTTIYIIRLEQSEKYLKENQKISIRLNAFPFKKFLKSSFHTRVAELQNTLNPNCIERIKFVLLSQ